jgi:hypothetical protein
MIGGFIALFYPLMILSMTDIVRTIIGLVVLGSMLLIPSLIKKGLESKEPDEGSIKVENFLKHL